MYRMLSTISITLLVLHTFTSSAQTFNQNDLVGTWSGEIDVIKGIGFEKYNLGCKELRNVKFEITFKANATLEPKLIFENDVDLRNLTYLSKIPSINGGLLKIPPHWELYLEGPRFVNPLFETWKPRYPLSTEELLKRQFEEQLLQMKLLHSPAEEKLLSKHFLKQTSLDNNSSTRLLISSSYLPDTLPKVPPFIEWYKQTLLPSYPFREWAGGELLLRNSLVRDFYQQNSLEFDNWEIIGQNLSVLINGDGLGFSKQDFEFIKTEAQELTIKSLERRNGNLYLKIEVDLDKTGKNKKIIELKKVSKV